MKCSVESCDRAAQYKTACLCQMHYFRQWRTGTTDPRKAAERWEDDRGYQYIHAPTHPLRRKRALVAEHRIVLYAKIGPGPMDCELCGVGLTWETVDVDHIDENPRNNASSNLRPLCMRCNVWRSMPPAHTRSRATSLTHNGMTMTPNEWSKQPGVEVTGSTIRRRKMEGRSDYEALFGPKVTHNGKPKIYKTDRRAPHRHLVVGGVRKTIAEWARDPMCKVTARAISLRLAKGMTPEQAIYTAPENQYSLGHTRTRDDLRAIRDTYRAKARELEKT